LRANDCRADADLGGGDDLIIEPVTGR